MSEFVLIHLSAQREHVINHVKGWSITEVINWMRQYGTVAEPKNGSLMVYIFESNAGFKDAFHFTENGNLIVVNSGWLS